jgi:hypothetical protein
VLRMHARAGEQARRGKIVRGGAGSLTGSGVDLTRYVRTGGAGDVGEEETA